MRFVGQTNVGDMVHNWASCHLLSGLPGRDRLVISLFCYTDSRVSTKAIKNKRSVKNEEKHFTEGFLRHLFLNRQQIFAIDY